MFCREHAAAPSGKRGGWLSSFKRRAAMGGVPNSSSAPKIIAASSLEVYDASNVAPKLWVGAKPPTDRSYPGVDVIVLCAAEYQPQAFEHFSGRILRPAIPDDALDNGELRRVITAATDVAGALKSGKRVLVTCQMGINRSALVAALALGRVIRATPDELVALLRAKRHPQCLYNAHFREYLRKFLPAR